MMIECKSGDTVDLRYSVQEMAWKQVHKVEIYFDTEKERDDFQAALNAGNVKITTPARWEPSPVMPGYVRCSGCHNCHVADDWLDGKKWKHCPECGAPMENGGQYAGD